MKAIKLCLIFLLPLLFSCSNYINKMYRELDNDQAKRAPVRQDRFDQYRNPRYNAQGQTRIGRSSLSRSQNSYQKKQNHYRPPQTRRSYRPQRDVKKRYTANDIIDSGRGTSSLWSGQGNTHHLFTEKTDKKHGDIILINVQKSLKNDVTVELKRAFPMISKTSKKDEKKKSDEKDEKKKEVEQEKVYDRVSCVVIEEINNGHLLVRGQKSVLFKNRKRLVEIQGLISRRDISDEDTIDSDKLLETSVHVLR